MASKKQNKRVTSAVYGVFSAVATAFVVSSTYQIATAVFASPPQVNAPSRFPALPAACASGITQLRSAVDRAFLAAAGQSNVGDAEKRYEAARSPEWDESVRRELVQSCTGDADGQEAVAAVLRFDRAAIGAVRRQTDELAPVRRTVDSFIR